MLARADSLTAADSASYTTMSAIGQAYEGMFRYKEAYTCFQYCLSMDTTNVDALNALARAAINYGKITEAKRCYGKVLESDSLNFTPIISWHVFIISWVIMINRWIITGL